MRELAGLFIALGLLIWTGLMDRLVTACIHLALGIDLATLHATRSWSYSRDVIAPVVGAAGVAIGAILWALSGKRGK
jgi:hypothetical protein